MAVFRSSRAAFVMKTDQLWKDFQISASIYKDTYLVTIQTSINAALLPHYYCYSDAVQMIFTLHSCMHIVGQAVSVGRLDQLLIKYYKQDIERKKLTPEKVYRANNSVSVKCTDHCTHYMLQLI